MGDVGCAVGRASFELTKSFDEVIGVDFSSAFINACNDLIANKSKKYSILEEGQIFSEHIAELPSDIQTDKVKFTVGDACNLDTSLGTFDAVLASNLLCRLPDPMKFLNRLPTLLNPSGVIVLVSPYSWLEEYTPQEKWLGGNPNVIDPATEKAMPNADFPFLIREHARKFQWGCSEVQVWRK